MAVVAKEYTHMTSTQKRIATTNAIAYVLAWIIGLSTGVPTLALNASGQAISTIFMAHKTAAILQFILTQGLTGLFLTILVINVWRGSQKSNRMSQLFLTCGLVVGVISLVMCLLGLHVVLSTAAGGTTDQVRNLINTINRIDGPKMWLLGLLAIGGIRMGLSLPRWLTVMGYVLAVALLLSGLSYGLLWQELAWSVYISGVLLLVWMGAFGIIVGKNKRAIIAKVTA